jgi:hypothetical protein
LLQSTPKQKRSTKLALEITIECWYYSVMVEPDEQEHVVAVFDQTVDAVIPDLTLGCLPFSSEPVSAWKISNDLGKFVTALYDVRVGALMPNGEYKIASARVIAPDVFKREHVRALELSELFKPSREISIAQAANLTDFDNELGKALKYFAAWDAVSSAVL